MNGHSSTTVDDGTNVDQRPITARRPMHDGPLRSRRLLVWAVGHWSIKL